MFKHIGTVGMIFVLLLASVSGAVSAYEPEELSVTHSDNPEVSENLTVTFNEVTGEVIAEYDGALSSDWDEIQIHVQEFVNDEDELVSETSKFDVPDPEGDSFSVVLDDETTSFLVDFRVENFETNEDAVVDFQSFDLEADDGDSGGLFDGDDNTTLYVVVGVVAGLLLFLSRP